MIKKLNLKCPSCDSGQVYTKRFEQKRVCKKCGNSWDVKNG